jgi:Right handed beta helix region
VASGGEAQNHEIAITCGDQPGSRTISGVLAHLDPTEPHTIRVSGACQENVTITGFDRLKLIAQNGASITDASGGVTTVVSITDSLRVSFQGFTINGSGPSDQQGVLECITSNCFFSGNTFQNSGDSGANVVRGAHAYFNGDVFDNTGGPGLFVGNGAYVLAIGVTAQRNADAGVRVFASTLQILDSTVQNNALAGILAGVNSTANIGHTTITGNGGDGIQVADNGTANVSQTTITGNGGDGIGVISHSTLLLRSGGAIGNSVTGNHGAGILVKDLSFADLSASARAPNVVTGNGGAGGKDVLCSPQFPATRGVAGIVAAGGTTNCVEP